MKQNNFHLDYPCLIENESRNNELRDSIAYSLEEIRNEITKDSNKTIADYIDEIFLNLLVISGSMSNEQVRLIHSLGISRKTTNFMINHKIVIDAINDIDEIEGVSINKNEAFKLIRLFLESKMLPSLLQDCNLYDLYSRGMKTEFHNIANNFFTKMRKNSKYNIKNIDSVVLSIVQPVVALINDDKTSLDKAAMELKKTLNKRNDFVESLLWFAYSSYLNAGLSDNEAKKIIISQFDENTIPRFIKELPISVDFNKIKKQTFIIKLYPLYQLIMPRDAIFVDEKSYEEDIEKRFVNYKSFNEYKKTKMEGFFGL